ncbi:MAG: prephenate dehydratase [Verrucomicrobia bacterium CG_4_10_14_3_um_filter_43_23]|nr:MAG: chorismate mutase [Verrucomicrobia bacterium CG1_02_43_26]PIP58955.1 MAG: prephenate dehydratase [Verrucomicrobia bacterium CG22_combo_CG10-13_8_21_14_all_43_17]PIX57682.1 MAG: prephenate dehydratase [Verrucomicrobia bacterium CG_4_10_14_3_um_filter_43_23]PIY61817.1 MAG: prephenate dehydratase [Verrucomicrobia bacterium CG_4_10_14_0_8_um_filter_43_34]PJA44766.1 MAG: prephenate dehydratase [Verrucomicrobia bacterium CG_4_9_14_3_um_filter_43_20]
MDLDDCRKKIDEVDHQIVDLLNERLLVTKEVGKIKQNLNEEFYVPEREKKIFEKLEAFNKGPLTNKSLRAIFREVISAGIANQKPLTIAYFGPEGTFTHQAAVTNFGSSVSYVPYRSIQNVFVAVEKSEADYGVVPIENSTDGAITHSLDQLSASNLKIIAQVLQKIDLCLISQSAFNDIKRVYSIRYALAQCQEWLTRNLPHAELLEATSTTHAIELAKASDDSAAVAGKLASTLYDAPVVAEGIQDLKDNCTRFLIIAKNVPGGSTEGDFRTSITLTTKHEHGSLSKILKIFADESINLLQIESRPIRGKLWEYAFFIDIEGHWLNHNVAQAIEKVTPLTTSIKWLGSYPA